MVNLGFVRVARCLDLFRLSCSPTRSDEERSLQNVRRPRSRVHVRFTAFRPASSSYMYVAFAVADRITERYSVYTCVLVQRRRYPYVLSRPQRESAVCAV